MEIDSTTDVTQVCVERLGETAGRQFAALARRGFRLERATGEAPATGLCRLGGDALLEPGTAWPEFGGFPLSLHAVLDTDALAGWLGDELPTRPGLLNVFFLDPDAPYDEFRHLDTLDPEACRVIAADRARAVETATPPRACSYPATPVHASAVTMLPDCWDVGNEDVDYDEDAHWGAESLIMEAMSGLNGNTADRHCAFGWPDTSYSNAVSLGNRHLLQLAGDGDLGWGWGDAGTMYFLVPPKDFAAGDFSRTRAIMHCA